MTQKRAAPPPEDEEEDDFYRKSVPHLHLRMKKRMISTAKACRTST
ncbi:WSSV439 [White spot syndrome virus]|uniref:WSSV439 n=1 Tax=White spot syndrome virus TaxID=342409 RepID=A0A2I6SCC7_9VIRU|nr:WSSV439 [White spot syndrome virus]